MKLVQMVENLAGISQKDEKEKALARYMENDGFKRLVHMTYSPTLNYYIKKATFTTTGEREIDNDFLSELTIKLYLDKIEEMQTQQPRGKELEEIVVALGNQLTAEDQKLLLLLLDRNLRIGATATTINKVMGEEFIYDSSKHYMRCSLPTDKILSTFDFKNACVQEKMDGAYFELSRLGFRTRAGNVISKFVLPVSLANVSFDGILMGEMLIMKAGQVLSREDGNGIINSMLQGTKIGDEYSISYRVWDWRASGSEVTGICSIPYKERYDIACKTVEGIEFASMVECFEVQDYVSAMQKASEFIAQGGEGAILKSLTAPWKAGTSKDQIKLKVECDVDLVVVELVAGNANGKHANTFGSLLCKSSDGLLEVNVSGISDAERKAIAANPSMVLGKVLTVTFNNLMKTDDKYSLFLPRAAKDSNGNIAIRNDKTEADSIERIIEAFNTTIGK